MQALAWQAQRTAEQVRDEREQAIADIEREAAQMWYTVSTPQEAPPPAGLSEPAMACRSSGACEQWFAGTDHGVRNVAATVCGPLLERWAQLPRSQSFAPPLLCLLARWAR